MPIIYSNLVGGQDELVFDGQSFVIGADGKLSHRLAAFEEKLEIIEFDHKSLEPLNPKIIPTLSEEASAYQALVTGVRDYVTKNGFPGVVIGR